MVVKRMSKLEKLIAELCPNGVEFIKLGEHVKILRGKRLTTRDMVNDAQYPVYHGGIVPIGKYDKKNRNANTTMIINVGASAGTIGYSDVDFWSSDGCFCLEQTNLYDDRFLFHIMLTYERYLKSKVRRAGIPTLDNKVIEKLVLPVPPLEVQREIVRVLDSFTLLTAELTAELTARKKQYEFYREELLKQKEGIAVVKLKEIAIITRGGSFQKKDFVENGFPAIHYGQIYTRYGISATKTLVDISDTVAQKSKKAVKNDIVMAVTSENVEDVCKCVAWLGDEDIAVSGHTAIIHHSQNAKYLAYYFHTEAFAVQKRKLAHGAKVIEVTPDKLNDIVIPLPDLKEQERIVNLLDRFDSLCNDISEGLPAEIDARQKQYEYYRDKLLPL